MLPQSRQSSNPTLLLINRTLEEAVPHSYQYQYIVPYMPDLHSVQYVDDPRSSLILPPPPPTPSPSYPPHLVAACLPPDQLSLDLCVFTNALFTFRWLVLATPIHLPFFFSKSLLCTNFFLGMQLEYLYNLVLFYHLHGIVGLLFIRSFVIVGCWLLYRPV